MAETETTSLFRQGALEAAAGTQLGDPVQLHWRGVRIFTAVALALFVMLLAFACVVEYSPIHKVPAYLDVKGGLIRLRAPSDGAVAKRILVREGERVGAGDLLAILESDRLRADGASRHSATKMRIEEERDALSHEVTAAKVEAEVQRKLISRRIAGLRTELEALLADRRVADELLASLETQSQQIAEVGAQGYATRMQVSRQRDEVLSQKSRVANTKAASARVQRDIETAESELRLIDARLAGLVENKRRSAAELSRTELGSDAESEQVLRAPRSGIVSSALVAQGQSLVVGQTILTIVPQDEPLIVRLLVPARAAGSVRQGAAIKVAFSAYPREKFGQFSAQVLNISDSPTLSSDVPESIGPAQLVFVAVAALTEPPRDRDGTPLVLKPGMQATALVPIERRTVMAWLLEPFTRGFNESAGRKTPEL